MKTRPAFPIIFTRRLFWEGAELVVVDRFEVFFLVFLCVLCELCVKFLLLFKKFHAKPAKIAKKDKWRPDRNFHAK